MWRGRPRPRKPGDKIKVESNALAIYTASRGSESRLTISGRVAEELKP
jgi:hypothetical protein